MQTIVELKRCMKVQSRTRNKKKCPMNNSNNFSCCAPDGEPAHGTGRRESWHRNKYDLTFCAGSIFALIHFWKFTGKLSWYYPQHMLAIHAWWSCWVVQHHFICSCGSRFARGHYTHIPYELYHIHIKCLLWIRKVHAENVHGSAITERARRRAHTPKCSNSCITNAWKGIHPGITHSHRHVTHVQREFFSSSCSIRLG